MCETPSPARRNRPLASGGNRVTPHAGFSTAQPTGSAPPQGGPSLIGWPRQLTWSDFRDIQSRPGNESENARISMGLHPGRLRTIEEGGQYRLGEMEFNMVLNSRGSWVVASAKSSELLNHEQGHYDMAGLCYRDLVNEVRRLRESSRNRLIRAVSRVMREHGQRADTLSRQYDAQEETNHGQNSVRQQVWSQQIQNCRTSGARMTPPA